MKWLKLFDGLDYSAAMLKSRKVQRDEAKLRKLGGQGNYERVVIQLSGDGPGAEEWAAYNLLDNAIMHTFDLPGFGAFDIQFAHQDEEIWLAA